MIMIKALVIDVDGVIVGDKAGTNFPLPHASVMQKLNEIHNKGIPIILCTAKYGFAIHNIITQAKLNNPHITDGGALIVNPLAHTIIKKHVIDTHIVQKCIAEYLANDMYLELYTDSAYYVQNSQISTFTEKRTTLLQQAPIPTDSLLTVAKKEDVIKLITFTRDDKDIPIIDAITKPFANTITFIWSSHPYLAPAKPGIITALHVSKAHATKEAIASLGLSFHEVLGVGDTASDWNFMQLCTYVATLANGDNTIKELVQTKEEANYFIAPHVNDNGMLDILKHFSLDK
jgi:hydroxymethylpyrimidine pyrophosphatase-like HAD family hydrolase